MLGDIWLSSLPNVVKIPPESLVYIANLGLRSQFAFAVATRLPVMMLFVTWLRTLTSSYEFKEGAQEDRFATYCPSKVPCMRFDNLCTYE